MSKQAVLWLCFSPSPPLTTGAINTSQKCIQSHHLSTASPGRGQCWAADLNLSPEKVSTDTGCSIVLEHAGTWGVFSLGTLLGVFPGADLRGWNARLRTCRGGGVLVSLAGKKKKKEENLDKENL